MLYRISNLNQVFDRRTVLNIPSLELDEGKIYALLGPNGAGKTTLLHILGFLEIPSSGRILYMSKPVRFQETELQRLRKEVVVVDQHPILFTTSVSKNIGFGLKLRGMTRKKREYIIDDVLEIVGMREFIDAPAHLLSGGETQRVALARALALSPRVFLCDEPTSSLDAESQEIVINTLRQINTEKNITVLFTTHVRTQATLLAQSTLILNHGTLVSTDYENIFPAQLNPIDSNQVGCIIQGKIECTLPVKDGIHKAIQTRVFIDPEGITPVRDGTENMVSNLHFGKVMQVIEENNNVRIVADLGVRLTILVSHDMYYDIKPMVGETLPFIIESEAIRVVNPPK